MNTAVSAPHKAAYVLVEGGIGKESKEHEWAG